MKTVKQIADEIGVDKQKVYRYIVRHGIHEMEFDSESGARNKTKYYDDQTVSEIKDAFGKSGQIHRDGADHAEDTSSASAGSQNSSSEDASAENTESAGDSPSQDSAESEEDIDDSNDFVTFLMQQLEEKDRQIFNLQKLLDQEQRLHLQTQAALDKATRRIGTRNTSGPDGGTADEVQAHAETAPDENASDDENTSNDENTPATENASVPDAQSRSDMIREVSPFEMKPVTPAPASEEEPASVQTVSEVLAQSAARREAEQKSAASSENNTASSSSASFSSEAETSDDLTQPIFHDTESGEDNEYAAPPKKKGFWARLFGR